jgi:predicted chitinase
METMNFPLSVEIIAAILGPYGPTENVAANWPTLEAALDKRAIYTPFTAVACIATVAVETGNFSPVKERGGPTYLTNLYENRKDLGNVNAGDGVKYRGRGFVQITGRWDYSHFGQEISEDLLANPDLAMDPAVAADILALFFHERHIPLYADQQNWEMVRRRVNGGLTGWPRFIDAVTKLTTALNNPPPVAGIQTGGVS